MKIKRTINEKEYEFELNPEELREASEEQKFEYDRLDILEVISSMDEDDLHGASDDLIASLIDEMAIEKRRNIDKYDMNWRSAAEQAVKDVLTREG